MEDAQPADDDTEQDEEGDRRTKAASTMAAPGRDRWFLTIALLLGSFRGVGRGPDSRGARDEEDCGRPG